MKIIEPGRNLKDDIYIGKCNYCDCKFESSNDEVEMIAGCECHRCPNCTHLVILKLKPAMLPYEP